MSLKEVHDGTHGVEMDEGAVVVRLHNERQPRVKLPKLSIAQNILARSRTISRHPAAS